MLFPRHLSKAIRRISGQFPVILLTGARQVGKTSLLQSICEKDRMYITFDDPLLLNLAKEDPALFFQKYTPPLFIDEVQYASNIFPYIKMIVERNKKRGLFWLSGSQPFILWKSVSESLAGRVAILNLLGLSNQEIQRADINSFSTNKKQSNILESKSITEVYELIWRGSFPELHANPELEWAVFYNSYLQTYIQRDLRSLARVGDESSFLRFLRITAARSGQILNYSELAKDADIAPNTAKQWISILETSGLIYLLQPYHNNHSKRLIKSPKLYFLDTGLCSYLAGWSSPRTLEEGAFSGSILETWVVGEILRSFYHNASEPEMYYYRDKEKREIDLLIKTNGTIYPVEIKKTAFPKKEDTQNFAILKQLGENVGRGTLLCFIYDSLPITEEIDAIPISTFP